MVNIVKLVVLDGNIVDITSHFSRFYHGVVLKQVFDNSRQVSFREWKDTNTGGCLIFYRGEDYSAMDELKQIFKLMNLYYPIEEDGKVSTRDITSKELTRHIEFVLKIMGENGILLPFIEDEWERMLQDAGIEKDKHE